MIIDKTTIIRLQYDPDFYYQVENLNIDMADDGVTLSYHEKRDGNFVRLSYFAMDEKIAKEIAKAILELPSLPEPI
jgi:hypothetical protein